MFFRPLFASGAPLWWLGEATHPKINPARPGPKPQET